MNTIDPADGSLDRHRRSIAGRLTFFRLFPLPFIAAGFLCSTAMAAPREYGVDVSHWQGETGIAQFRWTQMFSEGKRFVFVKATESFGFVDNAMVNNMTRASAAGLRAGVYHFGRPDLNPATSGAVAEADHFLLTAGNFIGPGYLRPVLDLEIGAGLGSAALTDWVIAFSDEIIANRGPGAAPIIYCSLGYANSALDTRVADYDAWLTGFFGDPATDNPFTGVFTNWSFWQYSYTGIAGGISPIDLDVCNSEVKPVDSFLIPAIAIPVAPEIAVQPQNRNVRVGKAVTLAVMPTVSSSTPLAYQWRLDDTDISGATDRAYTIQNAQLWQSGAYTVVLTNVAGGVTSAVAVLTVTEPPPPVPVVLLYEEDFDGYETESVVTTPGTTNGFDVFFNAASGPLDFVVGFGVNYSAVSSPSTIPSAPHSIGGTTKGLGIAVNKDTAGAAAAVNLYPAGQNFSGDFALKFDLWLNYGTVSSTEHALFGINHSGGVVNRVGKPDSDGLFFAVDGDGGVSGSATTIRDFSVFQGGGPGAIPVLLTMDNMVFGPEPLLGPNFDNTDVGFAAQFPSLALPGFTTPPGAPGQQWVAVEVRYASDRVTWLLNDTIVAQYTNITAYTNGNILIGYNDYFASIGSVANFVLFDNIRVETIPDMDANGLPDVWETYYFSTNGVDPDLDTDGDHLSNWAEYKSGTNPTNAASSFRLMSATPVTDDVRLDWTVVGGHSYVVQFAKSTPAEAGFVDVSPVIAVGGTNETVTNFLHTGAATNASGYYRVRLEP